MRKIQLSILILTFLFTFSSCQPLLAFLEAASQTEQNSNDKKNEDRKTNDNDNQNKDGKTNDRKKNDRKTNDGNG